MTREAYRYGSEYIADDLAKIDQAIARLKQIHDEQQREVPEDWEFMGSRIVYAPNFHVSFHEVLNFCGYDAQTTYATGGEQPNTVVWARSWANGDQIDKIRQLEIAAWGHPLQRIIAKASSGEFRLTIDPDGTMLDRHAEIEDPVGREVAISAWLLSRLTARIKKHKIDGRDVPIYDKLRDVGHRPLGFEEIGGLAVRVAQETLEAVPELAP